MSKRKPRSKSVRNRIESLFEDLGSEASAASQVGQEGVEPEGQALPDESSLLERLKHGEDAHPLAGGRPRLPGQVEKTRPMFSTVAQPPEGGEATLLAPFQAHETEVATLEVIDDTPGRVWSEDERRLVEQVADQLSLALENARLFQDTQAALAETQTLYGIVSAATRSLDLQETLSDLLSQVLMAVNIDAGLISMYDETAGKLALLAQRNLPEAMVNTLEKHGLEGTLCEHVFRIEQAVSIEDFSHAPEDLNVSSLARLGFRSYLGVPLVSKGRVLGTLCAFGYAKRGEQSANLSLMQVAGQQIGIAVENASLFSQTQQRAEEMSILHQVSLELAQQERDLDVILKIITDRMLQLLDADGAGVWMYREGEDELELVTSVQASGADYTGRRLKVGEGLVGQAYATGQIQVVDDYITWSGRTESFKDAPFRAALAVPMVWQTRVIGAMVITRDRPNMPFLANEQSLAELLSAQAAAVLQNARLFNDAERRGENLAVLNEMGQALTSLLDVNAITDTLLNYTARLMPIETFFVALFDDDKEQLSFPTVMARGQRVEFQTRALGQGLTDWVVRHGEPLLLNGWDVPDQMEKMGIRFVALANDKPAVSWLGVPILYAGKVLGVISLQSITAPYTYTIEHLNLLTAVASQASNAIQNARLFTDSERRSDQLAILNELGRELSSMLDVDAIAETIHGYMLRLIVTEEKTSFVALYNAETQMVHMPIVLVRGERVESPPRPLGHANTDYILRTGETLLLNGEEGQKIRREKGIEFVPLGDNKSDVRSWLGVPIRYGDQILGVLSMQSIDIPYTFSQEHQNLLTAIASQAASAIQNARLFTDAQRRSENLAVLNELGRTMGSLLDVNQICEAIYTYAGRLMPTETFFVALYDRLLDEVQTPVVYIEGKRLERPPRRLGSGLSDHIIRTGDALLLNGEEGNRRRDELGIKFVALGNDRPALSWLGVPVRYGDEVLGVISLQSVTTPYLYTEEHLTLLTAVSSQAASAIQNARLLAETQVRADQLAVLNEMSTALAAQLGVEDVIKTLYTYTGRLIDCTNFFVALYDAEKNEVSYPIVVDQNQLQEWEPETLGSGLTEHIIRNKQPLLLRENVIDWVKEHATLELVGQAAESWLGVPLLVGEQVLGVVAVQSYTTPNLYHEGHKNLLNAVASAAAIAVQNARSFEMEQRRLEVTATLLEITQVAASSLDMRRVLRKICQKTAQVCQASRCSVFLIDSTGEAFQPFMSQYADGHLDKEEWRLFQSVKALPVATAPFFMRAFDEQQPIMLDDALVSKELPQDWVKTFKIKNILAVPMISRGVNVGLLTLDQVDARRTFKPEQINLAQTITGQVVTTVENARLFSEEQRRRQVADTLREITRVVGSTLDLREVADRMLNQLANLADFERASIQLIQGDTRRLVGARGFDLGPAGSDLFLRPISEDPLVQDALRTPDPLVISDTHADPRWQIVPGMEHIRSWLAAPLVIGRDTVGLLTMDSAKVDAYSPETTELIRSVAAQTAVAVQNANLFQQTQIALGETAGLYQASAEINTAQDYEEILQALRRNTIAGAETHHVNISYFDRPWSKQETPQWVEVLARWTDRPEESFMPRYPLQAYPSVAQLLKPDAPLIIEDLANDPRLDDVVRDLYVRGFRAASALFIPLVVGAQWVGFINANYPTPVTFPENEIRRLMALGGQAAVAVQNLRSVSIAEQRAQEAQERSEELGLVNRVVSAMVSSPDLREVLDAVAGELIDAFHLAHASIALLNDDRKSLTVVAEKSSQNDASGVGSRIPVTGNPSTEQVLSTRRPVMVTDAQTSPLLAPLHMLMLERGIETIAIFPIIAGGEVIGTIGLDVVDKGRTFTPQEISVAETLVGQISTSIQNANLYEQTQRALAESNTLYQASASLNAAQDYQSILDILRETTVLGHKHASNISINLFDRPWVGDTPPDWMIPIARWSDTPVQATPTARYPLSSWTTAKELVRPDAVVAVENALADSRLDETARAVYVQRMHAKSLVTIPLSVGGQWIGHVVGVFHDPVRFSEQDHRIMMALASQAAVAIQNLRLLDESRRRATQLETAAEIARDTSGTLALDVLLDRAVNLIRDRYGFYHASIFLMDETRKNAMVAASTGEAGAELKRRAHALVVGSQSVIGTVTGTGDPLVINDVRQSLIHRPNPLLPDTLAELAIPMKIGNLTIGALDVQATEVDAFSPDDVAVLQTLADQIAVAVDNARSYETAQEAVAETRRRVDELSVIYDLSRALASAPLDPAQISDTVVRYFIRVLDVPEASISLLNNETGEFVITADVVRGDTGEEMTQSEDIGEIFNAADYPATAKVIQTQQPMVVQASDADADSAERRYMAEHDLMTLVVLPLAIKGEAFGIIELEVWGSEIRFTPDQINLAMTLANSAATALENARLYEEQRATAEQLRELDKLKSQFLANMSHELRTPLNSIIGFSRVILKGIDGPISDMQKQDLTAINSAGQHLLELINDVLDISKIEAGKMELAFDEHVNLADLITSAMSTAVGLVKDKNVELVKQVPPDLPTVRADPTRVRQVLINFLSNAAKFTEEGSITVRAEVQVGPQSLPEVMVSVIDTGAGIAPEDQDKLFKQFSQVDSSPTRRVGGTGLGLSISRLLIEMHGGSIGVESDVGKGSRFYFVLPLTADALPPIEEVLESAESLAGERVVLAIDDDRQVLNLYERYLHDHGYKVVALTDPIKAVETARRVRPFAITLDVMMPKVDGWQVLEALKKDPDTRSIPVIICSIVEEREKGISLGAVSYLTKPILEDELVKSLNRLNGDGSIQEVLVVDDDEHDLRLVEKILQKSTHYKVRLAHGGPEGLAAIQTSPPHAIILDLFMPELDGFALLEVLRADAALRQIPVIIFTAGDLTDDQRGRLDEFSQNMLQKGVVQEEELLASIERALKHFKQD